MINGKAERFEKILRVRYRNIKIRKGRLATYICLIVLYFAIDIIAWALATLMPSVLIAWVLSLAKAIVVSVIAVCITAQLFGKDRENNQVGIEQRSGYDNTDIFLSRLIEVAAAYLVILIVFAILNGAYFGGTTSQKQFKAIINQQHLTGVLDPQMMVMDFLIIDIWYGIIAFIIPAAITIGCSYIMNSGGSTAMGVIFGIGIVIVIILASIGVFSSVPQDKYPYGSFLSNIPGYGKNFNGLAAGLMDTGN